MDTLRNIWKIFHGGTDATTPGKIISASVNKSSYDPDDHVCVNVSIKNTGTTTLSNLQINVDISDPGGVNVKEGILEREITLSPGQTHSTGYIDYLQIPGGYAPGIYGITVGLWNSDSAECYEIRHQMNNFIVGDTSIEIKDIIVRTPRNIDFNDEQSVSDLIDSVKNTCIGEISVLVKQDERDEEEKDASGVILEPGNLFYENTAHTNAKANMNYDVLQKFIDVAHANGIKVNAWIPIFKDKIARDANPKWGLSGFGDTKYFINPSNPNAREYELNIIKEILNYDIDGIRLDYVRYTLAQGSTESLVTFLKDVEDLVNSKKPGIEVCSYVSPVKGLCIIPCKCLLCIPNSLWSKQDYSRFKDHVDYLMPMVYWQDLAEEKNFECWITGNMSQSQNLSHGKVIPVLSVTNYVPNWKSTHPAKYLSEEEIRFYLQKASIIAKKNGVTSVSLFYYLKWTETELNRINAIKSSCV